MTSGDAVNVMLIVGFMMLLSAVAGSLITISAIRFAKKHQDPIYMDKDGNIVGTVDDLQTPPKKADDWA